MVNRINLTTPAATQKVVKTVGIRVHGVSLNLSSSNSALMDYMARLLPGLVGSPDNMADIEVNAHWIEGPCAKGISYFPDVTQLNGVGKRMQIAKDELIWHETQRDKDMQLRFRRHNGQLLFDVAYCYQPSAKKLAKYPNFKQKKLFDLSHYLVHFPIAWYLERTRGWAFIHAAAVDTGDGAVLIAGPGGAGKTTTTLALVAQTGMKLMTENLLFTDGMDIFPVVEPIRLTVQSMSLLKDNLRNLEPIELPGGLRDKTMFWLPQSRTIKPTKPKVLFLPQFSQYSFVRPILAPVASELIGASNRLTLGLNNYYWYTAALDMLWPQSGNSHRQLSTLQTLTTNTPCFALGINRSAGVEAVVEQILNCLKSQLAVQREEDSRLKG